MITTQAGPMPNVLDLNKGNYNGRKASLSVVDEVNRLGDRSVDEQWRQFKQIVRNAQQKYIPITNPREKMKPQGKI